MKNSFQVGFGTHPFRTTGKIKAISRISLPFFALSLVLAPSISTAQILDVTARVFAEARGQDADPNNLVHTIDQDYYPTFAPTFTQYAVEGRSRAANDLGYMESSSGLQFDAFSHTGIIDPDGPGPYGSGLSDQVGVALELYFTTTTTTPYQLTGSYAGEALGGTDDLTVLFFANIRDMGNGGTLVYQEGHSVASVDSHTATLGVSPNPGALGSNIGLLDPGDYRLVLQIESRDLSGVYGLTSDASWSFRVGDFVAVPTPPTIPMLLTGLLLLVVRIRSP